MNRETETSELHPHFVIVSGPLDKRYWIKWCAIENNNLDITTFKSSAECGE